MVDGSLTVDARTKGYRRVRETMREHYPRFSDGEMERRYAAAYGLMDDLGLDLLLLYGDSTLGHLHQLNAAWLSHYLDEQYSYVLVPRSGEPVLYVSIPPDAAAAMAVSPIEDVRGGGVGIQMCRAVADGLVEKLGSGRGKRIGVVDNFAVAPGLPHAHHELYEERLPGVELVRVAREYEQLKLVPSDEEMAWFRRGVELTDIAWEALVDAVEPGRTEAELMAVVHSSYMKAGGQYCFAILGSTPMADPRMAYPHGIPGMPSQRPVRQGDVVLCEMSGSWYGYTGQCFCAVAVGEPPEEFAEMATFVRGLYDDLTKVVRAGATDADVATVAQRVRDRGWDIEAPFVHAWGTHFGHPTVGFESWAPWDVEFVEGQLMVIEPNPCSPDALTGLQLGNLTQVGRDGSVPLHKHGTEFVVK